MAHHQLGIHILSLQDGIKRDETLQSQRKLLESSGQTFHTKSMHAANDAVDPVPISPTKPHRRPSGHQPLRNPLIPRLQYLTEIPPSPPVMLHLVDEAGAPVVHPLQIDPDSLAPADAGDYAESPTTSSSSRSAISDRDCFCLEAGQCTPVDSPLYRPPLAFLRKHGSETGCTSSSGTSNSSSSRSAPSPLAGTPITPLDSPREGGLPGFPDDDSSSALRSPPVQRSAMAGVYDHQEEARAVSDCVKMS